MAPQNTFGATPLTGSQFEGQRQKRLEVAS